MTKNKYKKSHLGYIEGITSVTVNLLLFGFKLWAGMVAGSIAMIADSWHTLSDSITSVIVVTSTAVSSKKPDSEHPFGHGRAEDIAAVIIGTLLIVVSINFFKESLLKLFSKEVPVIKNFVIVIFVISAIVKELLARFSIWAAEKSDSKTLRADGWHHRSDAITTAVIIVGFLFCKKISWLDGALGIAVSLFILYTAYEIIKDSSKSILGQQIPEPLKKKIQTIIEKEYPSIENAHHFHLHTYGDHRELTMHIYMSGNVSLKESHDIIQKLENRIHDSFGIDTTIHADYKFNSK